jgi:hypothetical protein
MAETTAQTALQQNPATIRPCTAQGLVYRAYKRPYGSGPANVLNLFASGYYTDAPWEIFFTGVEGKPNTYQLMEKVPTIVFFLVTYYAASYSSGYGLPDLANTVTIIDSYGEHQVQVETIG